MRGGERGILDRVRPLAPDAVRPGSKRDPAPRLGSAGDDEVDRGRGRPSLARAAELEDVAVPEGELRERRVAGQLLAAEARADVAVEPELRRDRPDELPRGRAGRDGDDDVA